ncbi:MAG: Rid family detoxifying hydrolase [Candidatus Neomarinimicrobiota bacterium]
MSRRSIHTNLAPEAIGPYSQAIISNRLIFTAGQIPLDPMTGKMVEGDFKMRVNQVLRNLNAILSSASTDLNHAVKMTVFLTDLSKFSLVNEVFDERFAASDPPARSVVEVAALPLEADIEIECIATVGSD